MDMEDNIDENEQPETVSTMEIQEQLREIARQQKGKEKVWPFPIVFRGCMVTYIKYVSNKSVLSILKPLNGPIHWALVTMNST